MTVGFAAWNLKKNELYDLYMALVTENDIHISVVSELGPSMRRKLERNASVAIVEDIIFKDTKIQVLCHSKSIRVLPREACTNRYGSFLCEGVGFEPFLLVGVHLPSQNNNEIGSLREIAQDLAGWIDQLEQCEGTDRTIVLGDFNLNPFDRGIYGRRSLNALPCRRETERNRQSPIHRLPFYNPTWSLLGDITPGPPGSHYYSHDGLRWNMYDQVLIRPGLMDGLSDLRLIETVGGRQLCKKSGLPDGDAISDHLPLVFKLNLKGHLCVANS